MSEHSEDGRARGGGTGPEFFRRAPRARLPGHSSVVLFDGPCNLCSRTVRFVVERDHRAHFRFASLQSPAGRRMLEERGLPCDRAFSIVLVEEEATYVRSDAVLRLLRRLRGAWPLLSLLRVVPRPLRDAVYDWVAAHRYRWFGTSVACELPAPDVQARVLEDPRAAEGGGGRAGGAPGGA